MTSEDDSTEASAEASFKVAPSQGLLRAGVIIPSIVVFSVAGAVLLALAPRYLLQNWLSDGEYDEAAVRLALGSAAQVVLFGLGGIIALVGVALSLSRHRVELESAGHDRLKEERRVSELLEQHRIDAERELRSRFVSAVSLLSDLERTTTRQAGVYALAALADDWQAFGRPDERQVCIDVLCSYLRSPWGATSDIEGERSIRSAGFNMIASHLKAGMDGHSWHGSHFDLRYAVVDFDADMNGVTTTDTVIDLEGARFVGGNITFNSADFEGVVSFKGVEFSGGTVSFRRAKFPNYNVNFAGTRFIGATVLFQEATFTNAVADLGGSRFAGGIVSFRGATFVDTVVDVSGSRFDGGQLSFRNARFTESTFDYRGSQFHGTALEFRNAKFSGGEILGKNAEIYHLGPEFVEAVFDQVTQDDGQPFIHSV